MQIARSLKSLLLLDDIILGCSRSSNLELVELSPGGQWENEIEPQHGSPFSPKSSSRRRTQLLPGQLRVHYTIRSV